MDETLNSVSTPSADAGQEQVVAVSENTENAVQEPVVEVQGTEAEKPAAQTREENTAIAAARKEAERKIEAERQKAKDETAAQMAKDIGLKTRDGKEVTTLAEFKAAKRDFELQKQGYDLDAISEIIKNDPNVVRANEVLAEQQKTKAKQEAWTAFFDDFRKENGRNFDPQQDKLPPDVLVDGVPNIDRYTRHVNKGLKERVAELEKQLKANETNAKNADSAVGSVKSDGQTATGDFITFDTFETNKHDKAWVKKHLSQIAKSRPSW